MSRLVVRELMILRKLGDTKMTEFYNSMHDIIIPDGVVVDIQEGNE